MYINDFVYIICTVTQQTIFGFHIYIHYIIYIDYVSALGKWGHAPWAHRFINDTLYVATYSNYIWPFRKMLLCHAMSQIPVQIELHSSASWMFRIRKIHRDSTGYKNAHKRQMNVFDTYLAVTSGNEKCLKVLLDFESELQGQYLVKLLSVQNHDGYTPLMLAADSNQVQVVLQLLSADTDVNATNCNCKTGDSALHIAARMGYHILARLLSVFDASLDIRN